MSWADRFAASLAGLLVELMDEVATPSTEAEKQHALDRSMAIERERLIREIEVSEGHRTRVWDGRP